MLHSPVQRAMASCSKGAWGLFVLSRGLGILTETAISPSAWSRQCPSRYAIRAGRNLPDKEFRYLRTVIVTAAVYRGFGSKPTHHTAPLLPKLRGQYAEFLDHVSLVHLRLLASPTCVGLRYGHSRTSPTGFSRVSTPRDSAWGRPPPPPS